MDRLTDTVDFHARALKLLSQRQQVLASNIANADTPGFQARDFDFKAALAQVSAAATAQPAVVRTSAAHLPGAARGAPPVPLLYRQPVQDSMDGNSVDMDSERAAFAGNAIRYEASLRFINAQLRTLVSAITGQ
jgi:flagellar basal-body rod protein FlgB